MGKVKAWLMEQQEEVQFQFEEGEIDARTCATKLAHLGIDPDEIEVWIDEATANRARNILRKALEPNGFLEPSN